MISDRDLVRKLGSAGTAFFGQFSRLREVQRQAIPPVLAGKNVLLTSATASGKTEAVFAPLVARITQNDVADNRRRIRILAIAPTRALVNDLQSRLERPLSELQWDCGRQTGDHSDRASRPPVLITTPESFDSMLVRGGIRQDGKLTGHLLADIEAVFVDEAHLFETSARGDQIVWMMARLRALKEYARRCDWINKPNVQVCAASATVATPDLLARKLLGPAHVLVKVPGSREVDMLSCSEGQGWLSLESLQSLQEINRHLPRANGREDITSIVRYIWSALQKCEIPEPTRKMLVFVPSRALCDAVSAKLNSKLRLKRDMYVGAHHASLERSKREEAERLFAGRRDAVLVATTTLEVGIDIGDVDAVCLVGCPSDVSSLLQRIGRAGRRSGRVRIVPLARDEIEAHAFASMIDTACRGSLETGHRGSHWSVFVQQVASYIAQTFGKGRSLSGIQSLADEVCCCDSSIVRQTIEWLVQQGVLIQHGMYFHLGETFSDSLEHGRGGFHCNFGSRDSGVPVVDSSTGDIVAYVADRLCGAESVALAGQNWRVVNQGGEILLQVDNRCEGSQTFRYAARSAPCGRIYAEHVRRGMGINQEAAPILGGPSGPVWFHFGGSAYEILLRRILPNMRVIKGLSGIALSGVPELVNRRSLAADREFISALIDEHVEALLASVLSPGKYHSLLPPEIRKMAVLEILGVDEFVSWLASRQIVQLTPEDRLGCLLVEVFGAG